MNQRTVTLEFLRHGPPHNQLLSPLTQYLALCGNHSATTVTIPFEHNQLLVRLRALQYSDTAETQKLQLKDTAQIMGDVLSRVPGLIAELAETPGQEPALTHLRLILSASELALLPFELANAPPAVPGASQPFALQAQAPVCITREVRRVSNTRLQWPTSPRILFAAAAPANVAVIPIEAHLLALRKVIDPWLVDSGSDEGLAERLEPHLVILPQATVGSIREACATGAFTHVHILAHGRALPGEEEKRYGLALHGESDPDVADVVDGARLAALLRTYHEGGVNRLSGPSVVTIASCESGAQGSVVGAGGSIAHALHEGGIPLVIAAQFPLTFAASVLMVEVLYREMLWGSDPRVLLNDLRWQLKARMPYTHDWASLVAYAALPLNLDTQLAGVQFNRAQHSIEEGLRSIDRVTSTVRSSGATRGTGDGNKTVPSVIQQMERVRARVAEPVRRLKRLLKDIPPERSRERARIYGLLASTEKRDAKILFSAHASGVGTGDGKTPPPNYYQLADKALRQARDYYALAFKEDRASSWALVQKLSLDAVLSGRRKIQLRPWSVARVLSEEDLYLEDRTRVAWAHANLSELYLLALLNPEEVGSNRKEAEKLARSHAEQMVNVHGEDSLEVYSHRRQIERYTDWFNEYEEMSVLVPLAQEILALLPRGSGSRFE